MPKPGHIQSINHRIAISQAMKARWDALPPEQRKRPAKDCAAIAEGVRRAIERRTGKKTEVK